MRALPSVREQVPANAKVVEEETAAQQQLLVQLAADSTARSMPSTTTAAAAAVVAANNSDGNTGTPAKEAAADATAQGTIGSLIDFATPAKPATDTVASVTALVDSPWVTFDSPAC